MDNLDHVIGFGFGDSLFWNFKTFVEASCVKDAAFEEFNPSQVRVEHFVGKAFGPLLHEIQNIGSEGFFVFVDFDEFSDFENFLYVLKKQVFGVVIEGGGFFEVSIKGIDGLSRKILCQIYVSLHEFDEGLLILKGVIGEIDVGESLKFVGFGWIEEGEG